MAYVIDESVFHELHPFSLITDAYGVIMLIGRSLPKILFKVEKGMRLEHVCTITQPSCLSHSHQIEKLVGELVVLARVGDDYPLLRGQVLKINIPQTCYLFSLNPAITNTHELSKLQLNFADFEIGAPVFDFLLLLRTQEISYQRLQKANSVLARDNVMLQLLQEVTAAVYSVEKSDEVYQFCLDAVCQRLDWDIGQLFICTSSNRAEISLSHIWSSADSQHYDLYRAHSLPENWDWHDDLPLRALKSGKPAWVSNFSECQGFRRAGLLPVARPDGYPTLDPGDVYDCTAVAIPVVVDGVCIAVIEFVSTKGKQYSESLLNFFTLIGLLIGRAVGRVQAQHLKKQQLAALAHASKMATLGQIVAGVAHEINNPVSTISLVAQILNRSVVTQKVSAETVQSQVKTIDTCVSRISQIVSELRGFSRDSTRDPFELKSLRLIISETVDLCHASMLVKGISLHVDDIPADWMIPCRGSQISQVLLNLINNAGDAVEDSSDKWVRIAALDRVDHFEVAVVDSGCGIPPEVRDQIMAPFFTTKPAGKGTGLGLSISANIMVDHEGRLYLDETSPHTRFVMTIPKHRRSP